MKLLRIYLLWALLPLAACEDDSDPGSGNVPIGTDVYVAVGNSHTCFSSDGQQWTNFFGIPGDVYSIAFGNNLFVAGDEEGRIWTTSDIDALDWDSSPIASTNTVIRDIAFANGRFVAVGEDFSASAWFSDDGNSWAVSDLSGSDFLTGLAYGDGVFVAVGRSETPPNPAKLWVSNNGENWTGLELGGFISHIAYGNGEFRITGSGSVNQQLVPICWSSPDGLTWTPNVMSNDIVFAGPIAYGNGRWVAAGSSNFETELWWSIDGLTWEHQNIGGRRPSDLIFADDRFTLVGEQGYVRWSETGTPDQWVDASIPGGGGWIQAILFGG